jgi:hypothetical protein
MNSNDDIHNIDDINILQEIYERDSKEAKELEKKLEVMLERFTIILDKIKNLRHLHENKSEEKEDISNNDPVEKQVKKVKKLTKKEQEKLEQDKLQETKEEEQIEDIEKEEEPKNKNKTTKGKKGKEDITVESPSAQVKKATKKKKKDDE